MSDTYCYPCGREFYRHSSLKQHWENANFHANDCFRCRSEFYSQRELRQHIRDSPRHNVCPKCGDDYVHDACLVEHMVEEHNYCDHSDCGRFFCAPSNLRSVSNSPEHGGFRILVFCQQLMQQEQHKLVHLPKGRSCPACNKKFATISAITLHLETGTCPSGVTKRTLDRYVTRRDTGNVITIPGRMIGNGNGYDDVETYATEQAWNGRAYECYFCPKVFGTLRALNSHLGSGYHQQETYRCLNRPSCGFKHRNLSALIQHIESQSCGAVLDRRFSNLLPPRNYMMIEA